MSLRRMAEIAKDTQNNVARDPLAPAAATILSSYTRALDTVRVYVLSYLDYMNTHGVSICTILGPTRGDVPGYCRVVAKASRCTHALRS